MQFKLEQRRVKILCSSWITKGAVFPMHGDYADFMDNNRIQTILEFAPFPLNRGDDGLRRQIPFEPISDAIVKLIIEKGP
jgi:hypothetical protein